MKMSLSQWLEHALNDKDKEGPCSAIALVHVQGTTQSGPPLHVTKLGDGGYREWTATDLADFMMIQAQAYCQDLPGVHTFQLIAFYGGKNEPQAWHPFMVGGQVDNNGLGTEAPTDTGERQQRMRHNDALTLEMMRERRELMNFALQLTDTQARIIGQLSNQLGVANQARHDAMTLGERVVFERAAMDREAEMALLKERRATKERQELIDFGKKMLPAFVNEVIGKEIIPQNIIDTELVESFAMAMDEQKLSLLEGLGVFPPHMIALLRKRILEVQAKAAEREEEALQRKPEAETDIDEEEIKRLKNGNGHSTTAGIPNVSYSTTPRS